MMTTSRMMMIVVAVRAIVGVPPTSSWLTCRAVDAACFKILAAHRVHGAGELRQVDTHAGRDFAHFGPRERFANDGTIGVFGRDLLPHRAGELLRCDEVLLVGKCGAGGGEKRQNKCERCACGRHRKTSSRRTERRNPDTGPLNSAVRVTALEDWLAALEKRHLSDLTFAEVSRALRALSSTYVERRSRSRRAQRWPARASARLCALLRAACISSGRRDCPQRCG